MSRSLAASGKWKKPVANAAALSSDEQRIHDLIMSKEGSGIQLMEIKFQTKIPRFLAKKAVGSLLKKSLIKEVKGGHAAKKIIYVGVSFTPSNQVNGGIWYQEGKIDTLFVDDLKRVSRSLIKKSKVATLEGLHKAVEELGVVKVEIPKAKLAELLTSMVLDNELIEVKSTGLGDCSRIPIGEMCYRLPIAAAGGAAKSMLNGAFAPIPCGMCPRIALCTPDGVISPATCVHYNKWLDIKL